MTVRFQLEEKQYLSLLKKTNNNLSFTNKMLYLWSTSNSASGPIILSEATTKQKR
jgi:hypothetical protein